MCGSELADQGALAVSDSALSLGAPPTTTDRRLETTTAPTMTSTATTAMLMRTGQLVPCIAHRSSPTAPVIVYDGQRRVLAAKASHRLAGGDGFEGLEPVRSLIVVLRRQGSGTRPIGFAFDKTGVQRNFDLEPGDIVLVP